MVKINAITVPGDSGDALAQRFAKRAGSVDGQDGFEGFELLRPLDEDRPVWLVVTRWRDEASFDAWMSSQNFRSAHGERDTELSREHRSAHGQAEAQEAPGPDVHQDAAPPGAAPQQPSGQQPVGMSAELWSYEAVDFDRF